MATTPTYINQRINNLQAQINSIISGGGGGVPTSSGLAVVLDNGNSAGTFDIDMNSNSITNVNNISNSGGQVLNVTADGNLNLSSNTGDCIIAVPNQIQLNATSGDISLVSVNGNNSINLNALNVNSFSFAMPICFDFVELDRNYNYASGGQTWELIWTQTLFVPFQFFTENPSNPYTSTKWRVDFTINTWNNNSGNNNPDKARAFYIDFQDQSSAFYPTAVITSTKPFCYHNNNSTWNGGGFNSEFIPVTWTDYVDFAGLVATGSGNVPLKFNVYFTADNPKNFDFSYKLGLTRVNLI